MEFVHLEPDFVNRGSYMFSGFFVVICVSAFKTLFTPLVEMCGVKFEWTWHLSFHWKDHIALSFAVILTKDKLQFLIYFRSIRPNFIMLEYLLSFSQICYSLQLNANIQQRGDRAGNSWARSQRARTRATQKFGRLAHARFLRVVHKTFLRALARVRARNCPSDIQVIF